MHRAAFYLAPCMANKQKTVKGGLMVTKYIPRKLKTMLPITVKVILKKDCSLVTHIRDAARALVSACPEIFKKDEPYPTVRLVKFKKGEIIYEISQGLSRAKTGAV